LIVESKFILKITDIKITPLIKMKMKKFLQTLILMALTIGFVNAQVYLTENFEGAFTGNPAVPAGWAQTRTVLVGDGQPEPLNTSGEKDWMQNTLLSPATWTYQDGTVPVAAVSGTNSLWIEDNSFSTSSAAGSRRMESPSMNLSASTSPYVRFWMFYGNSSLDLNLRVVASNDGGVTWNTLMFISPNANINGAIASTTPWQRINVIIPNAYKVANAKLGIELTSSFSGSNVFIDDFSVEEFTPTTITSLASGLWNTPATWVGGIVPTTENHVVIAATHVVNMNVNAARAQNVTVNGTLQYNGTLTSEILHVFGDLTINASGTYSAGSGGTGKKTYIGGSINNAGTITFQTATNATGEIVWLGGTSPSTFNNTGTLTNGRIPRATHANQLGVSYLTPVTISNYCGLQFGQVSGANITLGNPALAITNVLMERGYGAFSSAPAFVTTNVTSRQNSYITPLTTIGISFVTAAQTIIPGNEIELIVGNRQTTGTFFMNTYNNVQLNYPLSVGTTTGGALSLSRGIIVSSVANMLTLREFISGATGITPSTALNNGTNTGNHGSYVVGPLKMFFNTNTTNRTFPLGEGVTFHNNLPSSNVLRTVTLNSNATAWNSQTITTTIEGAPSGAFNPTITAVFGSRAYRLNLNGGPGLNAAHTLSLRFNNSTFGGSDNLVGNIQDIRLVQAPALNGPWSERSLTLGTGPIVNDVLNTRTSASSAPGPINTGDEYFAWGSTGIAIDMAATALVSPTTTGCYGPNQTVAIRVFNGGIVPIDFAVNNATVNAFVAGAVTFIFSPIVLTSGTLAANGAQTVIVSTTFNMSTAGTYSFDASVVTAGDNNAVNDAMLTATRNLSAPVSLPLMVDFTGFTGTNLPTVFPGWFEATGVVPTTTASNWNSQTGLNGPTNITARLNLWLATTNAWIISPKFNASAGTYLTFDAALTNFASIVATGVLGQDDKLRVMVSTDCGTSYAPIYTVSANDNLGLSFTNFGVSLGAYAGQDIIVAFYGTDGPIDDAPDMDIHLDNINIYNLPALDAGITAITSPASSGCYSNNQSVNITLKNQGASSISNVPVTVVISGAISQTLNSTYAPSIASQSTVNVNMGNINMSTAGTYSFKAYSSLTGDAINTNDTTYTTRTVAPLATLPQFVNFTGFTGANLPTFFPDWKEAIGISVPTGSTSNWVSQTGLVLPGNVNARIFLSAAANNEWILSPKVLATASTNITFDAAVTGNALAPFTPSVMGTDDKVRVMISTDCGVSYTPIYTLNASNNLSSSLTNFSVSLSAYAGQEIIVGILAQDGPIDDVEAYYFHLDNINLNNMSGTDAGITSIITPSTGCFSSAEPVEVVVKNFGNATISNFSVSAMVSGAVTQTITSTFTANLAPFASTNFTIGTLNMSTAGTYSIKGYTSLSGETNIYNDTVMVIKSSIALAALPQSVNFTAYNGSNLNTLFTGWNEGNGFPAPTSTISNWTSQNGLNGATNVNARIFLSAASNSVWIISSKVSATANSNISFDASITGNVTAPFTPTIMGTDDKLRVMVSTDCGLSYTPIFTINASNNLGTNFSNFNVSLGAYNGQDIIVALLAQDGPIDDIESYYLHVDNINLYNSAAADGGVSAILSPTINACLSATEQIVVTVNNYGFNPLTNFPVTAVISGPINSTVTSNYSGTLAPSASASYTIGTANMNISGSYSINAFTGVSGDPNAFNDATTMTTIQTPNFGISGVNVICGSGSTTLNVTGSAASYTWQTSATTSSIVVSPSVTTTYSALGTGTNNCQVSSFFTVTVSNPTITGIGAVVCGTNVVGTLTANAFAPVSWYSSPTSTVVLASGNTFTATAATTTTFYAEAASNATGSIQTTFAAGNGCGGGAMFDITPTNGAINLDSIDVNTSTAANTTLSVIIYYKIGTYLGNETNAAAWIAWDTITATSAGANNPTRVAFGNGPINIPNSTLYGIYVNYNAQYTNGTLAYTNSDITVQTGAGLCSQFGGVNAGRMFNGNLYYSKPGCISPKIPVTLTVSPQPTVNINVLPSSVICAGNSLTLTASGADTYTWNTSATSTIITATPFTSTTYTVDASSSLCPGSFTASMFVTVNANPIVNITPGTASICAGNSITLNANGGVIYNWNTSATTPSISVSPTINTTYSVIGTAANSCTSSALVNITVNAKPTVSIIAISNTACLNGGPIALTGSPAGGVFSGPNVSGSNLMPSATGTFNPVYSFTNSSTGCSNSATASIVVSICTDIISQTAKNASLKVYPNPNLGTFTIETGNSLRKTIELTDLTGRIVYKETTDGETINMNITELANGIYHVRISSENGIDIIKVVKQ